MKKIQSTLWGTNVLQVKKGILGFSLIELLVVISIIGILMVMASVAYSTAQKRGRDARRRGDIKAMQDGFEQYYSTNTATPYDYGTCAVMGADASIFPDGLPIDPKGAAYACGSTVTFDVCICAAVEGADGNSSTNACAMDTSSGAFYCLTNLQ